MEKTRHAMIILPHRQTRVQLHKGETGINKEHGMGISGTGDS